ncbi:MAG: hypothetical protein WA966_12055 [Ornithinimicrobium sp.]
MAIPFGDDDYIGRERFTSATSTEECSASGTRAVVLWLASIRSGRAETTPRGRFVVESTELGTTFKALTIM